MAEDPQTLIRLATTDSDAGVRRDACRRITDLGTLTEIADRDQDAGVREIATARYRNLLCGQDQPAPPLAERIRAIDSVQDSRIREIAALSGKEPELRRAAIQRVSEQSCLAQCALNDSLASNRVAAVERIDDKTFLEAVAKNIGKRDKNVYRIARQKLKEIIEHERIPQRARDEGEQLCEKLERLGRFNQWVQDRTILDHVDRQWAPLQDQVDAAMRERYQGLRSTFLAAYEAYSIENAAVIAQQQAQQATRQQAGALLDELGEAIGLSTGPEVRALIERIDAAWHALDDSLSDKEQAKLRRRYETARQQAEDHGCTLADKATRNTRLTKLLDGLDAAMAGSEPLDERDVGTRLTKAEELAAQEGTDKAARERFRDLREPVEQRLRKQKKHAKDKLAQLQTKMAELEQSLADGELKKAEPLYQSLEAGVRLAKSSGLPTQAYSDLAQQVKTMAPRVRELQHWRRWGTDQRRDELCLAMEQLSEAELETEPMAEQLRELQLRWKEIDQGGSPAGKRLWDRFHAASERTYERCRAYFDAQAEERDANRTARETLCVQLETFLEQVDWERMDWKKALRAEREMRQTWANIGPTEGRHRRLLEKRFRGALKQLDKHLDDERGRNHRHKQELIAAVEALTDEADLAKAIDRAKDLQRQWQTTVPGRQRDENRLWQQFRGACDAVFARRKEQQQTFNAELKENLQTREAVCSDALQLAEAAEHPEQLQAGFREFEQRWHALANLPIPRQGGRALEPQWQDAKAAVQTRMQELLRLQQRAAFERLAAQSDLCHRIEQAALAGDNAAATELVDQWQSLAKLGDTRLQARGQARFDRAVKALNADATALAELQQALEQNAEQRRTLCLQLEILARVDSPPELMKQRLEFQVERLSERMAAGEQDPLQGATGLLHEWYLCGPVPADAALEARFAKARGALEQIEQDPGR